MKLPANNEIERLSFLLKFAGHMIDAVMDGLERFDTKTRKRIMQDCGEACAREEFFGPAFDAAKRISEEEIDADRILMRANKEISWCGKWIKSGRMILCTCSDCGCPLVKNGIVTRRKTFCYCSLGWHKIVFETLFKKPVRIELETAIGFGDEECRFVLYI